MLKHIRSYNSYFLFESAGEMTGLLGEINKVVQDAMSSGKDSQEVTQIIRDFFQANKSEIANSLGDPKFIKGLIIAVSPWYDTHSKELTKLELADLDSGISLDDESTYDEDSKYNDSDSDMFDDEDLSIDF